MYNFPYSELFIIRLGVFECKSDKCTHFNRSSFWYCRAENLKNFKLPYIRIILQSWMLVAKLTTQKLFQYVQSTLKLLGVHIDDQLTFSKHIGEVCKKASGQVGVLMPMSAKLQLCKSAILPHLSDYHTVWYFFQASDKRKLELTQERPLSAVFINRSDSYEQLIHRANLHTLNNRRLQDIAILMYKVKHNLAPKYIQDMFCCNFDMEKTSSIRNSDFRIPRLQDYSYVR